METTVKRWAPWVAALLVTCGGVGMILDASTGVGGGGASGGTSGRAGEGQRAAIASSSGTQARSAGLSEPMLDDQTSLPPLGPRVVKTADIRVRVGRNEFRSAWRDALGVTSKVGGFAVTKSLDGRNARRGTLVLRVPVASFEQAVNDLEALGRVRHEDISGKDVSREYVDLTARLRNATAQEAVLLRLMDEAQTVVDTIRVQRELEGIQLTIETLRGQLRYLEDQTAMSTITVWLGEARNAPPAPVGTLAQAWEQSAHAFLAVVAAIIVGAGFVLPLAVVLVLGLVVFRVLRPRVAS